MASLVAAVGSLASLALVLLFIPNFPKTREASEEKRHVLNLADIGRLLFVPGVGALLTIKLVCGVPIGVLQSMFSGKDDISFFL